MDTSFELVASAYLNLARTIAKENLSNADEADAIKHARAGASGDEDTEIVLAWLERHVRNANDIAGL